MKISSQKDAAHEGAPCDVRVKRGRERQPVLAVQKSNTNTVIAIAGRENLVPDKCQYVCIANAMHMHIKESYNARKEGQPHLA